MEDTIDCQEQLEQRRKLFDDLYLEYQGKEVFSGKDDQVTFESILDNLTDQGGLTGWSTRGNKESVLQYNEEETIRHRGTHQDESAQA
jgi:hypothetical protein